jgi:NAD(P)-dependent dehydrogenase (short-subunit alcohol dehydrogenase family)
MKPSDERAEGRVAPLVVVTGAGRGVGFETALALATEQEVEVLAVSRDVSAWSTASMPQRVRSLKADVSTEEGRGEVVRAIGDRSLAALVNNAGALLKRTLGEWQTSELDHLFAVNARSPLMLTQALLPALGRGPSAHVVNISSMGGFQGSIKFPGLAGYSASKAALACITECLAEELKDTTIRCNCLCLGAVDTAMLREAFPAYQAQVTPKSMGSFIAQFVLNGHKLLNGKVLPVSLSTP